MTSSATTPKYAASRDDSAPQIGLRAIAPSVVVAAASIAAAAVCTLRLGDRSLWFDEGATIGYARLGWSDFAAAMGKSDIFFAFYYALMHLWISWFGESEAVLRGVSVFFGVAAVVAIGVAGRQLRGPWTGAVASVLAASSAFVLGLSRDARPYSMLIFVSAIGMLAFLAAVRRPSAARWTVFAIVAIVAAYVHLFSLFSIAAIAVWALIANRSLFRSGLAVAIAAIAVAASPIVIVMAHYGATNEWIDPVRSPNVILYLLIAFAGSRAALLLAVAAIAGALVAWKARPGARAKPLDYSMVGLVAAWALVPIAIAFAISLRKPIFIERYLAETIPACIVGLAIAITALPRAAGAAVIVAWVALAVPSMRTVHGRVVEDWRAASASILANARPGDELAIYPGSGLVVYDYYRRREGRGGAPFAYPRTDAFPLDTHAADDGRDRLPALRTQTCRLWIVLDPLIDDPETDDSSHYFVRSVPSGFAPAQRERLTRITVLRYDAKKRCP